MFKNFYKPRAETGEGANDGLLLWRILKVLQSLQILRCRGDNTPPHLASTRRTWIKRVSCHDNSWDTMIIQAKLRQPFGFGIIWDLLHVVVFAGTTSGCWIWSSYTTRNNEATVKRRFFITFWPRRKRVLRARGLKRKLQETPFKACV